MELFCIGISHRTADVATRERFAVADAELPGCLRAMLDEAGLRECVGVSTCNRVEFYGVGDGRRALEVWRGAAGDAPPGEMVYTHPGQEVARHLFRVVAGLDSMVLGETEILGQVKKAYQAAADAGATSGVLNRLFQRAFRVAKEVRSSTRITRGPASVGAAAVELAERIFGKLGACKVMILGAGETAEQTARAFLSRGARSIFVANRSHGRAVELADAMGGAAIRFDEWERWADDADILIGSTAAPHPVVTRERVDALMARRPERPLFAIDLAVPRDVEPSVNDLDGVYVYDMDALKTIADESLAARRAELAACEAMIEKHVAEFAEWCRAHAARNGAAA